MSSSSPVRPWVVSGWGIYARSPDLDGARRVSCHAISGIVVRNIERAISVGRRRLPDDRNASGIEDQARRVGCRPAVAVANRSEVCFFFNDTATTEIYTLSLHDALPI